MTEATTTAENPELGGRSEGLDELGGEVLAAPITEATRKAAMLGRGESTVDTPLRAQLLYIANMRQMGRRYLVNYPPIQAEALLWRLVAAVAIATSVAACGLLLCVGALVGTPVRPNPYVSLAILLVGITLCATVATVVHGDRPRIRRR